MRHREAGDGSVEDRPRRVLLVDDDESVRLVTAQLLGNAGYQVLRAASATEALRHLDEQGHADPIDVVITDLNMPGMDGGALHREIGTRWPGLDDRVILMTGDPDAALARRRNEHSTLRVLPKPFTRSVLVAAIDAAIAGLPHMPTGRT